MSNGKELIDQKKTGQLSAIDRVFNRLSDEQAKQVAEYAVKEKVRLEIEAEEAELKNQMAIRDMHKHFDAFNNLPVQKLTDGHKIHSEIETASGKMTIYSTSGRPGAGTSCFVATATYQNPHHPDVEYLRKFRDRYLIKTNMGRSFVVWYYDRSGPYMASLVKKFSPLRYVSLIGLSSLICMLRILFPCEEK